jgi:hypothetical protein
MDATLCKESWHALPSRPAPQAHARMVHLVLSGTGGWFIPCLMPVYDCNNDDITHTNIVIIINNKYNC